MKSMKDLSFPEKRVLVRADFNVPLDDGLNITDDTRIRFVLPTINHLIENKARVILCSHLGRPKGGKLKLDRFLSDWVRQIQAGSQQASQQWESEKTPFVDRLPHIIREGWDIVRKVLLYVLIGIAIGAAMHGYVPENFYTCARKKELPVFRTAMKTPKRPLVAVVGGAKVSSKLKALYSIINSVDTLVIGGAMANTFLLARGHAVGRSKVEPDLVDDARKILARAKEKNITVYLPVDAVTADSIDQQTPGRIDRHLERSHGHF